MEKVSRPEILKNSERTISCGRAVEQNYQLVDVRSGAEFLSGSMVGAASVPLFDEGERSVIGTLYNHGGRDQAIDLGFDYAEHKLEELLEAFEPYRGRPLAIYCARGGMRSLAVVNLLCQSGHKAYQISGGYKQYRNETLDRLVDFAPKLIVIHGLTGTGKTRILHQLPDNSIDLEGLACHRSSLFGGLDRQPSNQRNFEARLVQSLVNLGREPHFIEGESRKIGRVFIPKPLAMAMKEAVLVNVHCSLEKRVERIVEDYPVAGEEKREEILRILRSLKQNMGAQRVAEMCELFIANRIHELVAILLVDYYDKRYARSMSGYNFDLEISSENIPEAAQMLRDFRSGLLAGG